MDFLLFLFPHLIHFFSFLINWKKDAGHKIGDTKGEKRGQTSEEVAANHLLLRIRLRVHAAAWSIRGRHQI
jgi:hypothetical protein